MFIDLKLKMCDVLVFITSNSLHLMLVHLFSSTDVNGSVTASNTGGLTSQLHTSTNNSKITLSIALSFSFAANALIMCVVRFYHWFHHHMRSKIIKKYTFRTDSNSCSSESLSIYLIVLEMVCRKKSQLNKIRKICNEQETIYYK